MNVRVLAYRSADRADLWCWDRLGLVLALLVAAGPLVVGRPLLALALVPLIAPWMTRIRLTRAAPGVAQVAYCWGLVPLRRRTFELAQARSAHADDFTAPDQAPPDQLVAGSWSLDCRDAATVLAWLRASSVELGMPTARSRPTP